MNRAREALKAKVSPGTRDRLRRAQSRFRWAHKYRRLREFRRTHKTGWRRAAAFVLLDPEVENFTFDLRDEGRLARFWATVLDVDSERIARYVDEARHDPELNRELTRRVRWRWDMKRRLPLGRRLGWYAIVRVLRPQLVVETGVHAGLGSLTILRALERNREEGSPGRLMSFDVLETTGRLVPERLRRDWTPCFEQTYHALEQRLAGERVDLLFQDLGAGYEAERYDYETVSSHAATRLVLVGASSHLTSALADFAADRALTCHETADEPRDHVFGASRTAAVVLDTRRAQD